MNRKWLVVLALCSANTALAQEPGVSVSVGARAWYTEWTTFSYFADEAGPTESRADPGLGRQEAGADAYRQCALP